jgi:hypothetical protein
VSINRISGNILQDNLQRGANLSFQGNLIFVDVLNNRVGVRNSSPTDSFDVTGTAAATDVRVVSATANGIFYAGPTQLALTNSNLQFDGTTLTLTGTANVANINIAGDIVTVGNISGGNLSTTGQVTASGNISGGNLAVTGDVSAADIIVTGEISATGNVTGGNVVTAGDILGNNLSLSGTADITGTANIANVNIAGNSISADSGVLELGSNANVSITGGSADYVLSTDGSGNLTWIAGSEIVGALGNLAISNTTILANIANGNITLEPAGTGLVIIDTVTGLTIPVGNTAQQPDPALTGTIRFNTDAGRLEVYDGAEWDSVAAGVTNQLFSGDDSTVTFALDRSSTSAATLVMFNGVVQIPSVAYVVTANSITFAEAPLSTDVIDIRFL